MTWVMRPGRPPLGLRLSPRCFLPWNLQRGGSSALALVSRFSRILQHPFWSPQSPHRWISPKTSSLLDASRNGSSPEVVGTRAYVVNFNTGLVVFDVTNPALPVPVLGTFTNSNVQKMTRLAISGNIAYIEATKATIWRRWTSRIRRP